jgi:hypothetical protein
MTRSQYRQVLAGLLRAIELLSEHVRPTAAPPPPAPAPTPSGDHIGRIIGPLTQADFEKHFRIPPWRETRDLSWLIASDDPRPRYIEERLGNRRA